MANSTSTGEWVAARRKFIEAGGHTTQSFGLGRIIGQIYSLLYLSPTPLCLDEIAEELGVSKASVSTTIRQLQSWTAVKRVWMKGDRRDFYEAETDFKSVIRRGLLATMRKKLETAGTQIDHIETCLQEAKTNANGSQENGKDMQVVIERLERAKQFHGKVHGLLSNPLLDHLL
jgi:DNA-binding transcriptional regulator GbsR (MarR family)